MSQLQAPRAVSTEAFLAAEGLRLADLCTACGECLKACPLSAHLGIDAALAVPITEGLRHLARGEMGHAETVRWVGACAKSGLCVDACPEKAKGLDAMLLVRIARQHALNETNQLRPKADPTAFPRVKTFARLQLTDEELKRWL